MQSVQYGQARVASEWSFNSAKVYANPFDDVELDVEFRRDDLVWRVPAFWAGGNEWRVRFAPPEPGTYSFKTHCSDEANYNLHAQEGSLKAEPYSGNNPLLKHGPLRVSANKRYLEHEDGKAFFWLGDTWWYGLWKTLDWPVGFQWLTEDRRGKGFNVIQIIMGPFPEMEPFDPREENEAGHPWEPEYRSVNPDYFAMADLRIRWLVRSGLVPCIFACWGYHLHWLGQERMKRYWRYLVARYGAYPVVWCLAGEGTMPYYSTAREQRAEHSAFQKRGWAEVGRYLRGIDPMHRLITIHPDRSARDTVAVESVLDFDMLQTGHSGLDNLPSTVETVMKDYARTPIMPVIDGEVTYEGHKQMNWQDVQRTMFWVCILNGACGHTYGAGGLWQMQTREQPLGPSGKHPAYEDTPWDVAAQFPGSKQLGLAKALIERYQWWRFEPHHEWTEWPPTEQDYRAQYAAGIPRGVRFIYCPNRGSWGGPTVQCIEPDVKYKAFYFDPVTGKEYDVGTVQPDANGTWKAPRAQLCQDWILVLESGNCQVKTSK